MAVDNTPQKQAPENPIRAMERQIKDAKNVKDVLKVDITRNRYVANFEAMSGRKDGLQQYESEVLNFIELANNKPEIMQADRFSIMAGFMRAATYNLSFQGNDLSVYVRSGKLVVEPQAHGKRRMLEKMKGVKEVHEAVVVFTKDDFVVDVRNEKVVRHHQTWPRPEAKPETVVGAYCTIEFKDGSKVDIVIDQHEIRKAREASKMTDGGQLWTKYYGEAVKKTAYNRAFKVKWRKPETAVLYEQWEAREEETLDAQVVQDEPNLPASDFDMPADSQVETQAQDASVGKSQVMNIDTETGEVITKQPMEEPKTARPRRGKTSDGDLGL